MIERIETLKDYLSSGGNLFIFPEGTRSRNGNLSPFMKGGFSIAKFSKAPIELLKIKNTDTLFPPGRFLFNTCIPNTIEIERLGIIIPDYDSESFSIHELVKEAHSTFQRKFDQEKSRADYAHRI